MTKGVDIHRNITDTVIRAIEAGAGQLQMPWHRGTGGKLLINTESYKHYRGANALALWCEAQLIGFASNVWGTYRKWTAKGAQVRKGAKASYVVFYREIAIDGNALEGHVPGKRLIARATPVFNANQVDGLPAIEAPSSNPKVTTIDQIEQLISETKAVITHSGTTACFIPGRDEILMPLRDSFIASKTSTPTEAYYSTLLHERSHWTGVTSRCGAAFLCAELGLTAEPRVDHAQYLAGWLKALKTDKRAIFNAASKAAQGVAYIRSCSAG